MQERGPSPLAIGQEFLEFHGDSDIFVTQSQEAEYLEAHGIYLHGLDNGVTVAAATRMVPDEKSVNLNVNFPTGSYCEDRRIGGVTHLQEHIVATAPLFESQKHDVYFNAATGAEKVSIIIQGTANPDVPGYGVWPIISLSLGPLASEPALGQDWLEKEKLVVIGEMHEKEADMEKVLGAAIAKIIFAEQNPLNYNGLGTRESLANITVEDVVKRFSEVFIPQGALATIACSGNQNATSELIKAVERQLARLPDLGKKPERLEPNFKGQINPDFQNGGVYSADTGIKNKLVTIQYSWLFPTVDYSIATIADLRFFHDVVQRRLREHFRKQGLGYVSDSAPERLSDSLTIFDLRLRVPKVTDPVEYATKLYPALRDYVLGDLGEDDIEHVNTIANRRISAIPTSIASRFGDTLTGLQAYGRIIDSDKVRNLSLETTADQLKQSVEKFGETNPAIIVVGDIN